MKRFISIFVALIFCCSFLCVGAMAEIEGDYEYTIDNGAAVILKYSGSEKDVVIPETLGGLSVKGINSSAFSACSDMKSVVISQGVTTIGDSAFSSCMKLERVVIPGSVAVIEEKAFSRCPLLSQIVVDEGNANYKCDNGVLFSQDGKDLLVASCHKQGQYVVPDEVTTIWDGAFYGCTQLTSVIIPGSVNYIGWEAFSGCTRLASVTIGQGVVSIDSWAFENCPALPSVTIPSSVTDIGKKAFGFVIVDKGSYLVDGFVIKGVAGSVAQTYANENGIVFEEGVVEEGTQNSSESSKNANNKDREKDENSSVILVLIIVGGVVLVTAMILGFLLLSKKKKQEIQLENE